jgi:hypothetical protein
MRSRSIPGTWSAFVRRAVASLACAVLAAAAAAQPKAGLAPLTGAQRAVLDRFVGTWEVTATTRVPKLAPVKSTFTWGWVLDRRYLRGESDTKSDGSQEMQVLGHDAGGYPLWIFASSGLALQLGRGEWDEATRTMAWKNAPTDPVLYVTRCTFESASTLRCSGQVKTLAGKVMIDSESVAVRRKP